MAFLRRLLPLLAAVALLAAACDSDDGTSTPAATGTATATPSGTATATATPSAAATASPAATETASATETATETPAETATATATESPTETPTVTVTPDGDLTFDPADADGIAHAAMLEPADLPGEGWTITEEDEFSDGFVEGADPNEPSCQALQGIVDQLDAATDPARAGRAQRQISSTPKDGIPLDTDVTSQVSVFLTHAATEEGIELYRQITEGDDLAGCLQSILAAGADPGTDTVVEKAEPNAEPPEGGLVMALDISLTIQAVPVRMKFEAYLWAVDNAGVSLSMAGLTENMTPELANAAIDALAANMDELVAAPSDGDLMYDPAQGDDLAAMAIPLAEELPGEGWDTDATDEFTSGAFDGLNEESENCIPFVAMAADVSGTIEAALGGRAQRGYEIASDDEIFTPTTAFEVSILDNNDDVSSIIDAYRDAFEDEGYAACITDTVNLGLEDPSDVTTVDPTGDAPDDGAALAFEFTDPFSETGDSFIIAELYAWQEGNALVEVIVGANKDQLDPDLAQAAIDRTVERLEALAAGDILPTATPVETETPIEAPTATPATSQGKPQDILPEIFFPYAPNGCYTADGSSFDFNDCPVSASLRTRLSGWDDELIDPICRCVSFPAAPDTGTVVEGETEATIEIPSLGLTLAVVYEDDRWVLDDTYCTTLPEGTSIYEPQVFACFQ